MATSGSYAFNLDADELLTEAWERCGKDPETLTDRQGVSGLRSLQLALDNWTNAGLNLWQVDRITVMLAPGQASVVTEVATTDVLEAYVSAGGSDTTLSGISRQEWMGLPNKTQAGTPSVFWSERINAVPVLHLWPVPLVAMPFVYSRIRLPQDLSTLTQHADAPRSWLDALAAELARRLAVKWAPDRLPILTPEAAASFANAAGENRERVGLHLVPSL